MRRLLIIVWMLSVGPLANAQYLEKFVGEQLVYQLNWSLLGFGVKAGEAYLWCEPAPGGGYLLGFHGFSKGLARKLYKLDNRANVLVDSSGLVQQVSHCFSNQAEEKWQADYRNQLIYHSFGNNQPDTLEMSGYQPRDALSSIYLLRQTKLHLSDTLNLPIMGYDSAKCLSSWKQAQLIVVDRFWLKLPGDSVDCWQLEIRLDPKDNLFPGRNIKLYITADDYLKPVLMESDFYLLGLLPSSIKGRLVVPTKKDGP